MTPSPFSAAPLIVLLLWSGLTLPVRGDETPLHAMVPGFARFHADPPSADDVGALLLTELSCTSCHLSTVESQTSLVPKGGPNLKGAAGRIQASWLRKFLTDPQSAKPGTTMPSVMHHLSDSEREAAIQSLIAFMGQSTYPQPAIVSTASNPVATEFWRKGDSLRGQELYHQVGCVACHAPDQQFQLDEPNLSELEQRIQKLDLEPDELKQLGLALPQAFPSVPLPKLEQKYTAQSLTMFLVNPLIIRPAERMPHLNLAPHEAADIAAHLLKNSSRGTDSAPATAEQVREGAAWYGKLGCLNCHGPVTNGAESAPQAPTLEQLAESVSGGANGCFSDGRQPTTTTTPTPRYSLSKSQRTSIAGALERIADESPPQDSAAQWMLRLNCYACHARGERGGVGPKRWQFFENKKHVDLGDEGRLPPPLDHVGLKLTPRWLEDVLRGKAAVRPHFYARMPSFPRHAKQVAGTLRKADRAAALPQLAKLTAPQPEILKAGRQLLNTGCVQCHPLFGEHLPGVMGVDISNLSSRMEPAWFQAFLRNPAQWKHRTRMPTFFPNDKSTSPDILGGNIERQIAAIWSYLNAPKGELPEKLEQGRAHNFLLTPKEEPLVLRTFMQGNVTHAIAVGFPERLHYAFDSEAVALPLLWRGEFLNAHPTWFDRFTPPTKPLGEIWRLPPLAYVATGSKAPTELLAGAKLSDRPPSPIPLQFSGYRLDKRRVPTMLYRMEKVSIEERIAPEQPTKEGKAPVIRRRIQATADDKDMSQVIWVAVGLAPVNVDEHRAEFAAGQSLSASAPLSKAKLAGANVALAPLKIQSGRGMLEVRYQWTK